MEFFLNNPKISMIIVSTFFFIIGYFVEKYRSKATLSENKVDDGIIKLYDFLVTQSKNSTFRNLVYKLAKLVETKYIKGEISKDQRYESLKKILKEKLETGTVTNIPANWEELFDIVLSDFCIDDKYSKINNPRP